MSIRLRAPKDISAVEAFLIEHGSRRVARLEELVDPLEHPALIAEESERLVGVLTFIIEGESCEILTIHAAAQRRGVGTALIQEVERLARDRGCSQMWLITTNDNVDALRFYQRRGFRLVELHPGAIDDARARLKPEIPRVGDHGIPLRDELLLEKTIG
jgi:GNAT superfamily N-acetyltransferase